MDYNSGFRIAFILLLSYLKNSLAIPHTDCATNHENSIPTPAKFIPLYEPVGVSWKYHKRKYIQAIGVYGSAIVRLTRAHLSPFTDLKTLEIYNSSIAEIDEDAFADTPHLNRFSYKIGPLKTFPPLLFNSTAVRTVQLEHVPLLHSTNQPFLVSNSLEKLVFNNTGITKLPSNMFEMLPNLTSFSMFGDMSLVDFLPELFKNTTVNNIELNEMKLLLPHNHSFLYSDTLDSLTFKNVIITDLHAISFDAMPKLDTLRISLKAPTKIYINPAIFENTKISYVLLKNVILGSENKRLLSSENLQLHLYSTQVKNVSYVSSFSKLPRLTRLFMKSEMLSEIDASLDVFSHTNFVAISLHNLRFKAYKGGPIFISDKLEDIDLVNYGITEIYPDIFVKLPNLRAFHVSQNDELNIKTNLSIHAIKNTQIVTFQIKGHVIEIPRDQPILYSEILEDLSIDRANISFLYSESFAGLPNLKNLSLQGNHLENLPDNIFVQSPKLYSLLIQRNQFKTLNHVAIFGGNLRNRVYFYIMFNDWVCDCNLYPFLSYVKNSQSIYSDLKCIYNGFNSRISKVFPILESECRTRSVRSVDISERTGLCYDKHSRVRCFNGTLSDGKIRYLQVSGSPLVKLTREYLGPNLSINSLTLTDSSIAEIDEDALADVSDLKTFMYVNGPLRTIPPFLFRNTNITTLILSDVELLNPSNEHFVVSSTLTELLMYKVGITEYHSKMFDALPNLKTFVLHGDGKSLINLSPNLFKNTAVSNVQFKNLKLSVLDINPIFYSDKIESIQLKNVYVEEMHSEFWQGLTALHLVEILNEKPDNSTMNFKSFEHANVEILRLINIKMHSDNKPLLHSDNLKELILFDPKIENLYHNSFSKLPNLRSLAITSAKHTIIDAPLDIFSYTNISKILLDKTVIKTLDHGPILISDKIESLNLLSYGNSNLSTDAFAQLPNLKYFNFQSRLPAQKLNLPTTILNGTKIKSFVLTNYLIDVPQNKFILDSIYLENLSFENAGIAVLYPESFERLPNLFNLTLASNHLETLPDTIFAKNRKLTNLDITDNILVTFDVKDVFLDDFKSRVVFVKVRGHLFKYDKNATDS